MDSIQVPDSVNNIRKVVHTRMGMGEGTLLASSDGAYTLRVMIPTGDVEENTAWKNQNEGLPHRNLTDMESGYFDYIFVSLQDSSAGNGVYIRHKPVYTDMKEEKNSNPEQISLGKNYPNPFNPTTKIQFSLPDARQVEGSPNRIRGETSE